MRQSISNGAIISLANVMPQAHENNRGIWAKAVEQATRKYAVRATGDVLRIYRVCWYAGTIGQGKVVIPTHLFKLIYDENKIAHGPDWIENTNSAKNVSTDYL